VHQFDPDTVGVGAIEKVQGGTGKIEGGPGGGHDGSSQTFDGGGDGVDVVDADREMGQAELVHRTADGVAGLVGRGEVEELDGDAVAADELRTKSHPVELHQAAEFVADGVGLGGDEAEGVAVEGEGALEVRDTDSEVGKRRCHGGLLRAPGVRLTQIRQARGHTVQVTSTPSVPGDYPGSADVETGKADLPTRFRNHAQVMARHGRSPLSVALMEGAADDLEAGGIVAELYTGVPLPAGQAPALRLLAALHRLVLAGQAPELAAYYPSVGGNAPPEGAWAVAEETLRANAADLGVVLRRGVQTNEPGRSAVLFGVLLWIADHYRRPVRLLEVGASAGLNLLAEHFAYRSSGALLGDPDSPLVFEGPWVGTPVPDPADAHSRLTVIDRRGCDIAPIDATSRDGQLALLSYIWPDEPKRLARMRAALEVAERHPPIVDPAPAGAWIGQVLSAPQPGTVQLVWQSVFAQYLTSEDRDELTATMNAAGKRATEDVPVVWARMEPSTDPLQGFGVTVMCWPEGEETLLARSGDHGPPVRWTRA
jgi:hypothetical protein